MAHPIAAISRVVAGGGGLGIVGLVLAPLHSLAEPPRVVAGGGGDSVRPALRVPATTASAHPSAAEQTDRNALSGLPFGLSSYSQPMERVWTFLTDRATMPLGMAPLVPEAERAHVH